MEDKKTIECFTQKDCNFSKAENLNKDFKKRINTQELSHASKAFHLELSPDASKVKHLVFVWVLLWILSREKTVEKARGKAFRISYHFHIFILTYIERPLSLSHSFRTRSNETCEHSKLITEISDSVSRELSRMKGGRKGTKASEFLILINILNHPFPFLVEIVFAEDEWNF